MDDSDIILNNILGRKSVRNFTSEKVDRKDLEMIVRAGMSAPSGVNLQPWEIIVFDDEKTLDFMVDLHEYSKMFRTATAGILVCANMDRTMEQFDQLWVQDCSACTQNMLLAIEALKLGGVWLGIYPIEERCQKLIDYYKLPDNIIPFALIAVGHPSSEVKAMDKWDDKKLHWDKW